MPSPHDLGDDLETLDAFLMSDQISDEAMMLSDLDGFLTGLAIGPELVPPSEWLPLVWGGGEEPVFDDADQAQSILGAIMSRYNEILGQVAEGVIEPIFMETPAGEVIAADWAEGFLQAIRLRGEAWEKLFRSEKHVHSLVPILALCGDEDGESLLQLPDEAENQFFADAGELVPAAVLEIAEFWRAARSAPHRRSTGPKTGRNDPCPCGSGKKFKKCCGVDA
jgi:uncharacterized protein